MTTHSHHSKILVFDTETTGKPPLQPGTVYSQGFFNARSNPNEWPRIVQLSYILYDSDKPSGAKIFDKYIEISDDIVIAPGAAAVHHIDREKITASIESIFSQETKIQTIARKIL